MYSVGAWMIARFLMAFTGYNIGYSKAVIEEIRSQQGLRGGVERYGQWIVQDEAEGQLMCLSDVPTMIFDNGIDIREIGEYHGRHGAGPKAGLLEEESPAVLGQL